MYSKKKNSKELFQLYLSTYVIQTNIELSKALFSDFLKKIIFFSQKMIKIDKSRLYYI